MCWNKSQKFDLEILNLNDGRLHHLKQCNILIIWCLVSYHILVNIWSWRMIFSSVRLFLTMFQLESNNNTIISLYISLWISLDNIPNHKNQSTIIFSFPTFNINSSWFSLWISFPPLESQLFSTQMINNHVKYNLKLISRGLPQGIIKYQ